MFITVTILLAALVLFALAVAMAWILGWANEAFHVEVDPKVAAISAALPGANCGGCGYVGCSDYAEALVAGDVAVDLCGPGGASCAKQIAGILGVELGEAFPYRPVVHCAAKSSQRLLRNDYEGEQTCAAANLVSGKQGCVYGCLGMGDCEAACKYDAIHVVDGLATVDYDKCIGCKACAQVCPRNIITMVPFKSERMFVIACSNQDFGPDVKEVCEVGCIGCGLCQRKCDVITLVDNRPVVDYDRYEGADFAPAMDKCPRGALLYVGKPTADDLAKTKGEKIPEQIQADFKTTVDDTQWWG